MRLAPTDHKRRCVDCSEEYVLTPDKPGRINQCADCGAVAEDEQGVERVGGNMVWAGKQAPEIEIKPLGEAQVFAERTRRFGAGVTMSITQSKGAAERSLFKNGQWMSTESLQPEKE